MENANQKSKAEFKLLDGQKTDFNQIFANFSYIAMDALELFQKDPVNFIMAFAIPVVVGGLLAVVLIPLLFGGFLYAGVLGGLISLAVFIVCGLGLNLVAYIALMKGIVDVAKGGKIDVVAAFKFGMANMVRFFMLGVKVFLIIFKDVRKCINAWFSPISFVENGGNIEQSITSSQTAAEGKTVTLVWNIVVVGIVASLASGILTQVWVGIFMRISYELANLGTYLISGLVTPFVIMCQFVLRNELGKHGGTSHATSSHTATHQ